MAEVHETHVERTRGSGVMPFVMFLLGALLIAGVALVLMNVHWTISWPAGRVDIGLKPIRQSPAERYRIAPRVEGSGKQSSHSHVMLLLFFTRSSTTDGSASVNVSPTCA